jgi:MraZ protein
VTDTGLYIGSALQGVDPKGRVAIPADFRATIERNSATRTVMVAFHPTLPCLRAFDSQWATDAEADFRRRLLDGADPQAIAVEREEVFGEVEQAPFDPSGRFILPDFFRAEAQIADRAFFIGAGPTFNIWAPSLLMASDSVPDRVRRRCAHLMADKVRK